LGRENPLDEFHRIAIDHFRDLASDAVRESESTFAEVEFTPTGVDLDANGMARPSSTWTYMVHANPMAAGGNVLSGMTSTCRGTPDATAGARRTCGSGVRARAGSSGPGSPRPGTATCRRRCPPASARTGGTPTPGSATDSGPCPM